MLSNIHTYELPEGKQQLTFQIYEVQGKNIESAYYPHKTDRPHRHNYYEIGLFVNGAGKHEIDFQTHAIHSHSVHFITPGQVHLISREEAYHGFLLVFSRDFYFQPAFNKDLLFDFPFFNNYTLVPILNLQPAEFAELMDLLGLIKKEYSGNQSLSKEILQNYLHVFLLKCKQFYLHYFAEKENMHNPNYALVQQFRTLVEQQFDTLHQVKDYSDKLAISPAVLNKYVKRITNNNASDIIIDRLILEAKRLLIHTELSNKEIAWKLNYEDSSYFSRIFRKRTGMSPSEFRYQEKEKYPFEN
ncbi:MAG: transcriptional regulator, AraC family [Adhaeribacter sp.]|nr:transcriptional regulator, AraC family [Adhaeribacter sp.]